MCYFRRNCHDISCTGGTLSVLNIPKEYSSFELIIICNLVAFKMYNHLFKCSERDFIIIDLSFQLFLIRCNHKLKNH